MTFHLKSSRARLSILMLLAVAASVAAFGACDKKDPVEPEGTPPAPITTCVAWTGQTAGARYTYPSTMVENGVSMTLETFYWSNGDSTTGGSVTVQDQQWAGGSGLDVFVSNINVNFHFTFPCTRITLKFNDGGGNENLRVNGQLANVVSLSQLHGTTLGGVNVSITGGNPGVLTLTGNITNFRIGGQEFGIDDICATRPGS